MTELLPCPFCGGTMMFRKALWPSDGNVDAVIHAEPTKCGLDYFSDHTVDESVIGKWNARIPDLAQTEIKQLVDFAELKLLIDEYDPANSDWDFRRGVLLDILVRLWPKAPEASTVPSQHHHTTAEGE